MLINTQFTLQEKSTFAQTNSKIIYVRVKKLGYYDNFCTQSLHKKQKRKRRRAYSFPILVGGVNLTNLSTKYGVTLKRITANLK